MKNFFSTIVMIFLIILELLHFSSVNPKQVYEKNAEDFQEIAEFVVEHPEITRYEKNILSSSFLDSSVTKVGIVDVFWDDEKHDLSEEDKDFISEKIGKGKAEIINFYSDGPAVYFVLCSDLASSKCLVYTVAGTEYPDQYSKVVEWLSDNWYICE